MTINQNNIIDNAKRVLKIEADEIYNTLKNIDDNFVLAVKLISQCKGRIVVSGMGKSGHIGRKISSTMSSTGTPAFFMHPGEASHGDLGMIMKEDVVIFFSNSGKSEELISIIPSIKRIGAKIISVTNDINSDLALQSDINISIVVKKEACPLGLAPTASSTVALALGDALAICVLEEKGFSVQDFKNSHPGGYLGKNNLVRIKDIMLKNNDVPKINYQSSLGDAIIEISDKKVGFTAIVDEKNIILGIFTDGDLRRALLKQKDINSPISECMSKNLLHLMKISWLLKQLILWKSQKLVAL
ncbi:KpsF/GutQ family sugar-phosphate isomerase [Methylophilaceae bacterium]|nr:KpsF/GutQ family sugar-phosphate isomerase [Methylophilaceae bacterium]